MNINKIILASVLILGISAGAAYAHGGNNNAPPPPPPTNGQPNNGGGGNGGGNNGGGGFQRPVDLIGPELGVTGAQFAKCFEAVNPAPRGTAPSKAREQANKAVLLPCLQALNPAITNDLLDSVSNKYRP